MLLLLVCMNLLLIRGVVRRLLLIQGRWRMVCWSLCGDMAGVLASWRVLLVRGRVEQERWPWRVCFGLLLMLLLQVGQVVRMEGGAGQSDICRLWRRAIVSDGRWFVGSGGLLRIG